MMLRDSDEIVLLRRNELLEMLGQYGLPPFAICPLDGQCAANAADCAPTAGELIDWIEEHRIK